MRDRFVWIGCAVYALVFTALGTLKYDVHRNLVDFGIFAQTSASALGCFCNTVEGSHWAFHFSPILYVAGVALLVARSPVTLIALQSIGGALLAPPIYGLARRRGATIAASRLVALTVWLYPPLAGLIFGDFHENVFAPAAVAWMLYAFDAGTVAGCFVAAAAVLAIKEDQAIFLAIAGALGAWRYRGTSRGRLAAAIGVAAVMTAVLFFGFIQPHAAAAAAAWQPQRFYSWGHADIANLSSTVPARAGFLLLAFAPLAFVPFASTWMLLAAAPLAEVLLSRQSTTFTIGTHYAGAWMGYVLVAFALAITRLRAARIQTLLWICVALCVVELSVADPLHPGMNLRAIQPRDVRLDAFLRSLPRDISVATQEEAYTHLALSDPYARLLPEEPRQGVTACFVLIDDAFPESVRLQEYGARLRALVASRQYVEAARSGDVVLYRSAASCR